MKNYYKTLGISHFSSKEEIKKAFRELALKYHPDKNIDQRFSERFKEINEAKQVLLDDFKKFQYDNMLIHFLSKNKARPGFKEFKRRKPSRRSFELHLLKETLLNKFFLGLLFTLTILVTIAFFKIPGDDPSLETAFSENAVKPVETAPLISKPIIASSYSDKKVVDKQLIIPAIKKEPAKAKPAMRTLYSGKKVVKKPPYRRMQKSKTIAAFQKHEKKKMIAKATPRISKHKKDKTLHKELTNGEMVQVLNNIKAEKQRLGSNSNCVQIIKTETSNVQNAFMLANFLKDYGYVISGREKIPTNSNGINIDVQNNCIMITIGTL